MHPRTPLQSYAKPQRKSNTVQIYSSKTHLGVGLSVIFTRCPTKSQTNGSRLAFQAPRVVCQTPRLHSDGTPIMNRALASRHSASRSSDALSKLIGTILRLLLNNYTLYSRVRFPSSEVERRSVTSVSLLVRLEDAIWT